MTKSMKNLLDRFVFRFIEDPPTGGSGNDSNLNGGSTEGDSNTGGNTGGNNTGGNSGNTSGGGTDEDGRPIPDVGIGGL